MYKKILVPVDRSQDSQKAIEHAVEIASIFQAKVTILHCYEYPEILSDKFLISGVPDSYIRDIKNNIEAHSQEFLKKMKDTFASKNVEVKIEFREGDAGENIINTTKELDINLIVMGSRHMGLMKRIFFTSTSNYVLHNSEIPIFIV